MGPIGMLIIAVYWPVTKLFAKRWPRWVTRTITKMMTRFPQDYAPTVHELDDADRRADSASWPR
jgi:hypothetical protein